MELLSVIVAIFFTLSVHAEDCVDKYENCARYVRYGHCKSDYYKQWMRDNCLKSCNFCGTTAEPPKDECKDIWGDCSGYLSASGDCVPTKTADVNWLKKNCRKTCTKCGPSTTPSPTIAAVCGKPEVQASRVIAGTNAVPHSWPWQILMLSGGRPGCGGSIISPKYVVTAAHCVSRYRNIPQRFQVRVGEHDTWSNSFEERDYQVKKIIVHPKYNPYRMDYDVALFELEKPIQMTKYVSPVCLPTTDVNVGDECYITGWGKIRHPGSMHHVLQQAKMAVVSNQVCYQKNKHVLNVPITNRMICSGDGGASARSGCHGDSGGPFVCKVNGRWELHGAVSWGSPRCKSSETYTVFARITALRQWIVGQMN